MNSNTNVKSKTVTVDLSNTFAIDNAASLTTANVASANTAGKQVHFFPLKHFLDISEQESAIITDVVISKKGSTTITSNAVTHKLVVARVDVTAGIETKAPTLADANEEILAQLTLSSANVTALETNPLTKDQIDSVSGSVSAGQVPVRFSDRGNGTIGGGIVIYANATTATLGALALTGSVDVTVFYKKVAN